MNMTSTEKVLLTGALCVGGYMLYTYYKEKSAYASIQKEGVGMLYDESLRAWAVKANAVDVGGNVISRLVMIPGVPSVRPSATQIQALLTRPSATASMEF